MKIKSTLSKKLHEVEFGRLSPDGQYGHIRTLKQSSIMKCPHYIMTPEHYRDDESCRCDDPTHTEMKEWGYKWSTKKQRWE